MRDTLAFWRNLVSNPRRVSAIAPSGAALGALMTRELAAHDAPIIELGPGTGVFTSCLIERGIPERQLVLVESGAAFAEQLARRFPDATVLQMDAARLDQLSLPDGGMAGAVVSGLPLLSMPKPAVLRILRGSFGHLREGGTFYQFTYGLRCPVPPAVLKRLGLHADRIGSVAANLPPASVYRFSRAAAPSAGAVK